MAPRFVVVVRSSLVENNMTGPELAETDEDSNGDEEDQEAP